MNRKLEDLRNKSKGKIYIYLSNERIGKKFLQDAENEGYKFGKHKPTKKSWSRIIALEYGKQLSYPGFVGHMCFQCNGGSNGNLMRVDYEKYINGDKDFLFKNKPLEKIEIQGKIF